jgi:hypothetical protein
MQVNVFITRHAGHLKNKMLVLPVTPTAMIPKAYQTGWIFFGTFDCTDVVFKGADIGLHFKEKGYAVLDAEIQDKQ